MVNTVTMLTLVSTSGLRTAEGEPHTHSEICMQDQFCSFFLFLHEGGQLFSTLQNAKKLVTVNGFPSL